LVEGKPRPVGKGYCKLSARRYESGGDFAGGATADVIRNTALLSAADRAAIATYIASLPPKGRPNQR
jgi:hypothetical protein